MTPGAESVKIQLKFKFSVLRFPVQTAEYSVEFYFQNFSCQNSHISAEIFSSLVIKNLKRVSVAYIRERCPSLMQKSNIVDDV